MVGSVALVLDRHQGDVLLVQTVGVHVAVHLHGKDPQQIGAQGTLGGVVKDGQKGALGMGLAGGHLFLADHQADVKQARGHVVPAVDGR